MRKENGAQDDSSILKSPEPIQDSAETFGTPAEKDVPANIETFPVSSVEVMKKTAMHRQRHVKAKKHSAKKAKSHGKRRHGTVAKRAVLHGHYGDKIGRLSEDASVLRHEKSENRTSAGNMLLQVKDIYREILEREFKIESEMRNTKVQVDSLENKFLARKIDDRAFTAKMKEFNEGLNKLADRKKEIGKQKQALSRAVQKIPAKNKLSLEEISGTDEVTGLLGTAEPVKKIWHEPQAPSERAAVGAATKMAPVGAEQNDRQYLAKGKIAAPLQSPAQIVSVGKNTQKKIGVIEGLFRSRPKRQIEGQKLNEFLRKKSAGTVKGEQLEELDRRLDTLMKKYSLSEQELEGKIGGADSANMMDSMNRLIGVLEAEKRKNQPGTERIETAIKMTGFMQKMETKAVGVDTEIKKNVIVTDFDRVYLLVNERGKISIGEIAQELHMPKQKVEECCFILRREKQLDVVYPPFGDGFAQVLDYQMRFEAEKLKKKKLGGKK